MFDIPTESEILTALFIVLSVYFGSPLAVALVLNHRRSEIGYRDARNQREKLDYFFDPGKKWADTC